MTAALIDYLPYIALYLIAALMVRAVLRAQR